jgi:hypothetical protein
VSGLGEVLDAADPALASYAPEEAPAGRWEGDRAFTLESVYEGFLLHYGEPRAYTGMDPDLKLLAGDSLYALGLERLAEQGDLAAVGELADLISACAQAQAEGRPEDTDALWTATEQRFSA